MVLPRFNIYTVDYNYCVKEIRLCLWWFMNKRLRNKFIVLACLVVGILVLDLVTKYVIDGMFEEGTGVSAIPGLFNIISVHNFGAAWGIFEGSQVMLIIMSLIFLGIFIWFFIVEKNKSWLFIVTFSFLFAGCLGNLYDRIVFGYVRDFIQFAFWQSFPIFNFADVFLTFGVIMFIIYLLIPLFKKEKQIADPNGKIVIEKMDNKDKNEDAEIKNDEVIINELSDLNEQKALENKQEISVEENVVEAVKDKQVEIVADSAEKQKKTSNDDENDKNKTAKKPKNATNPKTKNNNTKTKSKPQEKADKSEKTQKDSKNSTKNQNKK